MQPVVVRSQIKEIAKNSDYAIDNISGDFADKLNEKVTAMITEACRRAHENQRKTVMGRDL